MTNESGLRVRQLTASVVQTLLAEHERLDKETARLTAAVAQAEQRKALRGASPGAARFSPTTQVESKESHMSGQSAADEIEALAQQLLAEGKAENFTTALKMALRARPDLAQQHLVEGRAARR